MASLVKVACMVVLCVALVGAPMAEAIGCGQVTSCLAPCLTCIQKGGDPQPACCDGVKSLRSPCLTYIPCENTCFVRYVNDCVGNCSTN